MPKYYFIRNPVPKKAVNIGITLKAYLKYGNKKSGVL